MKNETSKRYQIYINRDNEEGKKAVEYIDAQKNKSEYIRNAVCGYETYLIEKEQKEQLKDFIQKTIKEEIGKVIPQVLLQYMPIMTNQVIASMGGAVFQTNPLPVQNNVAPSVPQQEVPISTDTLPETEVRKEEKSNQTATNNEKIEKAEPDDKKEAASEDKQNDSQDIPSSEAKEVELPEITNTPEVVEDKDFEEFKNVFSKKYRKEHNNVPPTDKVIKTEYTYKKFVEWFKNKTEYELDDKAMKKVRELFDFQTDKNEYETLAFKIEEEFETQKMVDNPDYNADMIDDFTDALSAFDESIF